MKNVGNPRFDEGDERVHELADPGRKVDRCAQDPRHPPFSRGAGCPRCRELAGRMVITQTLALAREPEEESPMPDEIKRCPKHGPGEHMRRNGCRLCRSERATGKPAAPRGTAKATKTKPSIISPAHAAIIQLRAAREDLAKKLAAIDAAIEVLAGA